MKNDIFLCKMWFLHISFQQCPFAPIFYLQSSKELWSSMSVLVSVAIELSWNCQILQHVKILHNDIMLQQNIFLTISDYLGCQNGCVTNVNYKMTPKLIHIIVFMIVVKSTKVNFNKCMVIIFKSFL